MGITRTPITRIFVDFAVTTGEKLELPPNEAHHIFKVLRARSGDIFEVSDAARRLHTVEVRENRETFALEELPTPDAAEAGITLYQAIPKGQRMDLVVEKATELGVETIALLVSAHSVVEPGGNKVERWRRLAESSARQSLQLRVPEVGEPVSFAQALLEVGESCAVLLHNDDELPPLESVVAEPPVSLFVGPEGGWSEEELRLADEAGFLFAQLGPYRLRSETAGMVAVARTQAVLEISVERSKKQLQA